MVSLNISLKKEAYERLTALKRSDESFSDAVIRLARGTPTEEVLKFAGAWSDLTPAERKLVHAGMKQARLPMHKVLNKWKL